MSSRSNNSSNKTAPNPSSYSFHGKRFAYAVAILSLAYSNQHTTNAFTLSPLSSQSTSICAPQHPQSTNTFNRISTYSANNKINTSSCNSSKNPTSSSSSSKSMIATAFKSSPVVVSEEAEALSHSETTLKLIPSYELFQVLSSDEGGTIPNQAAGNSQRDDSILKQGQEDTLKDIKLSDFVGCGGKTKIETLPDPFKMVEKELKPFADSISELVSSDQPILSMAAKHFFEKRHGKRFRPTIVQLVAKAAAAAEPEQITTVAASAESTTTPSASASNSSTVNGVPSISEKVGGVSGWEWSGASDIQIEGGIITPTNHKGSEVWRKQAQLGQIVEMIHVASLIHDDVLDGKGVDFPGPVFFE